MSVNIGTTFKETMVTCWSIQCMIDGGTLTAEYEVIAVDVVAYLRTKLWYIYPYDCEDHFDQNANNNEQYSVTLLPAETIAANIAAREA